MVTLDTQGNVKSVNFTGPARELNGVSAVDVADGVPSTYNQALSIPESYSTDVVLDSFTTMMQQDASGSDTKGLVDADIPEQDWEQGLCKVAAQVTNM